MSKLKELITKAIQSSQNTDGEINRQSLFSKMEEMAKIISVHGFMNVWFGCHNKSITIIIQSVFEDKSTQEYMTGVADQCDWDLLKMFQKLDESNRGKIITWIMENYEGVNYSSISKYYLNGI